MPQQLRAVQPGAALAARSPTHWTSLLVRSCCASSVPMRADPEAALHHCKRTAPEVVLVQGGLGLKILLAPPEGGQRREEGTVEGTKMNIRSPLAT